MSKNLINICLSCDDNYSKYAGIVIASVLLNSKDNENFCFYILDGQISQENKDKIISLKSIKNFDIQFVHIDSRLFETYKKIDTHSYITISTYYRLKLPSIIKNLDKILYLDCDIIVNSSLSELYNTDIKDYYAAAVMDTSVNSSGYTPKLNNNLYFNAGVLLFNLDKMRQDNIEEKFENYTVQNIRNIRVGDQEILNCVCQGHIKQLESHWNVQSSNFTNRSDYTTTPKIINYIGKQKPWLFGSMNYWKKLYFEVLQKTPWAYPANEKFKWSTLNQIMSILNYLKYRPLFFLRPRFYKALVYTYIKNIN